MKKTPIPGFVRPGITKTGLKMKLSLLLCTICLLQVQARSYSQKSKISLRVEQVEIREVFREIEKQSDFKILYKTKDVQGLDAVTLKVSNASAETILQLVLEKTSLAYRLVDKQIVIYRKTQSSSEKPAPKPVVQDKTDISGVVTDPNGMPLPGATVIVRETGEGTTTNTDGLYSIKVRDDHTLVFSFVGMETREVSINGRHEIDITLKEDTQSLEEIVLVGYGTQKRKDITGSVSKINASDIQKLAPANFDNALVGRAPGVYVVPSSGAPGAAASIRIRGITSVLGNNEPLYVIDGVPIEISQGQGNAFYSESFSNSISPLASINPQDIESIDILKDASATAIYGSRGANGVVIVNTKQGSYSSVPSISFNTITSISEFTNKYSMLDSRGFHRVIETAYKNAEQELPDENELFPYGRDINTDWQNETDQAAVNTNYYLNINGGSMNGGTLYSVSAGITDQKGAIYNTSFRRNNIRGKLETKASEKLRVGVNFNYSDSKNKGSNSTFYYQTIRYRPDIPIFDGNGNYAVATDSVQSNPYAKVRYPSYVDTKNLLVSLFGEYQLANGLVFKSMYSYTKGDNKSFRYTPSYDIFEIRNNRKGTLNQTDSDFSSRIFDNTLTYNRRLDQHSINAVVGASYTQNKSNSQTIRATDFPDDFVMVTPGSASSQTLESGGTISGLSSYFVRANYNFDDIYYLTFTGRADKSTKFGPENRWGYFPSGAIAWRISRMPFIENAGSVDDIKLRASYGKTGSANFSDFQYDTFFKSGSFYDNHNGVVSNTIPNPDIKWETTNQLDIAVDYSLFDRRVNGSLGYFNKKTSDQILSRDVTLETGGSSQFANIGDFQNKGFEFQLSVDIFRESRFQWTSEINLSSISSKVLKLNGGYYRNLTEGESVSYFSGYRVEGIFRTQDEIDRLNTASPTDVYQSGQTAPGDFKYSDVNGDGFIGTDDIDVIGNAEPDFFGGWNNIIRFGNLELSTLFNFSVGNYLFNANKRDLLIFNNYGYNYSDDIVNAWNADNANSSVPRLVAGDPNNNRRDSDFFIENASFFKLKNIHLTYKFDPGVLKKLFIQKASISLSASNVFVITSYSGLDPEVNYNAANNFSQGYDSAAYPIVRTFTLGLNLNL
ncbi:TonB-dependent receptor [Sinomicrobium weinanense]|uniref:TonB-dependent receptor n=1 Tax=Sinomicrobium weinanense TaxID=2842200 RepID=A0A926JQ71_9FLAO|nr:TonB-dependent receptor [Sinomicrobium weinanense]MBC9795433.1 TonB-dependent receptor [Sinomicrobium weinanense]MBU3123958.1 TonB-dependent receptor [Sinomicrobium weinanense]